LHHNAILNQITWDWIPSTVWIHCKNEYAISNY